MKIFWMLLMLLAVFAELNAVDFEIGLKGGGTGYYPADYAFRRRLDPWLLYIPKNGKGSEPKINGTEGSLFLKVTSDSGRFASYSQFTSGNGKFKYVREDPIFLLLLSLSRSSFSSSIPFVDATKTNLTMKTGRQDFFTDGIFYFFPNRFGAGVGYRSITATSNSNFTSGFRTLSEMDNRTFRTSGLQASLYGSFPLDKKGLATLNLRGSYFNLYGKFEQSYSGIQLLPPAYFYTQVNVGNAIVIRKGYEIDMAFNLSPFQKLKDLLTFFVGVTFQESKVAVQDFGYIGLNSGSNSSLAIANSYVFSKMVEAPIFAQPAVDRLYTIYFGASLKFSTKPKAIEPETNP